MELEVKDLCKDYGKRRVVDHVSFGLNKGQVVGLLGPNGAGKTTSFYMIVGFVRPTQGEVRIEGKNLSHLSVYQRARLGLGYLPQEASIFRRLSVEDNILSVLEIRRKMTKTQRLEELERLLEEFNIGHVRKNLGYVLSGGERRRTEIARALAADPSFLLLDEPFAGIDPIAVSEVKEIIAMLKERGIGVLITDHNVRDTLSITDVAHIIYQGRVVVSGDRDAIVHNKLARELYLGESFHL